MPACCCILWLSKLLEGDLQQQWCDSMLVNLQVGESEMSVTAQWHGHDLEAWNAAFDRWQVRHASCGLNVSAVHVPNMRQVCACNVC